MKLTPAEIWSRLNSTYWFIPVLMTCGSLAAVLGAMLLDRSIAMEGWIRFLYPSSVEGARALLSSATGSIITVVSVTFSVTIVALTVASQHFGPRLLDNFMREAGSKMVLGILIGTFVYCAVLLTAIGETQAAPFVPALALIGAVALLGISVGALIYFVHHVAHSIQIPHIVHRIGSELESSVVRAFADEGEPSDHAPAAPETGDVVMVVSTGDGYVQRIDERRLARIAADADTHVWIRSRPGDFAIAGAALVAVSPAAAVDGCFARTVNDAYVLGPNRTTWQDPAFSIDKLVEVALRALSPAVNEPFTAIACIDQLGRGLSRAAACVPRSPVHRDPAGQPRVYVERQTFAALLDAAFDPIRIFAGSNPAIYGRLLATMAMIAQCARSGENLEALRRQARRCHDSAVERLTNPDDRPVVHAALRAAMVECDAVTTRRV